MPWQRLAAVLALVGAMGCGGGSPTSPTGPANNQPAPALTFEIWQVESSRGPSNFAYHASYRYRNTFAEPVTVSVAGAVLRGPNGETFSGTIEPFRLAPKTVTPGMYSPYDTLTVFDGDGSHGYAERMQVTISYTVGGVTRTAELAAEILHPPLTLPPPSPTPPPEAPTQSGDLELRVTDAQGYWNPSLSYPGYQYWVCGQYTNISGRDLVVRRMDLAVTGPGEQHYPVEQSWGNLTPAKYGPLGTRFGCFASAVDYERAHSIGVRVRLIVSYTLDDGRAGSIEASSTNIRN